MDSLLKTTYPAADVTANWNTVLDNWDTADGIINSGDVILCTTAAAAGSPTDARYNLVRTGGNINTLQQVCDDDTTTTGAEFGGGDGIATNNSFGQLVLTATSTFAVILTQTLQYRFVIILELQV